MRKLLLSCFFNRTVNLALLATVVVVGANAAVAVFAPAWEPIVAVNVYVRTTLSALDASLVSRSLGYSSTLFYYAIATQFHCTTYVVTRKYLAYFWTKNLPLPL